MKHKLFLPAVVVIIFLAIVLRFWQLGTVPEGLYWDEVAMLVDAKSIVTSGHDMHGRPWYQVIFPSYGDYKLPVYIWLASVTVNIFGANDFALRLPSALAGVATVIVVGAIAAKLYGSLRHRKFSQPIFILASMLVMTLSPWSIMFSRTGFEGHVAQLLVSLSVLFLMYSKKYRVAVYLAALLGGLATYTYFSVRFVWPVVFLSYFLLIQYQPWWDKLAKQNWSGLFRYIAITVIAPLAVFGLVMIPMFRSPIYEDSNRFRLGTDSVLKNDDEVIQSNVYREIAGNTPLDRLVFHRSWLMTRELAKNYADNTSLRFLFTNGDPNLRHGTGQHGLFLVTLLPFFLVGLLSLYLQNKRVLVWLIGWWLVALLPASVPENTPHALRSLNALVPLTLIIGWGVTASYDWLKSRTPLKTTKYIWVGAFLLVVGLNALAFSYHYFVIYPQVSHTWWQQGYRDVATTILSMREDKPVYIQGIDDKLYLWFMAYGPYSGNDFASWPTQQYQHKSFDQIFFSPFPGWDRVSNQDSMAVVAGTPDDIQKLLQSESMRVVKNEYIDDPTGERKFQVVMIEKSL